MRDSLTVSVGTLLSTRFGGYGTNLIGIVKKNKTTNNVAIFSNPWLTAISIINGAANEPSCAKA
jgi:hypothetical protein